MEPVRPELITLAEVSLRAACLGCVVFLALKLARVRSSSVQHAAWTLCAASMLLLPVLSMVLPAIPLALLPGGEPAAVNSAPPTGITEWKLPTTARSAQPAISWSQWLWFAYLAVAAVLVVRLMLRWGRVSLAVHSAIPVRDPRALELLPANIRVHESDAMAVPITAGVLRPGILLPAAWREWDDEKLRAALLHEAIHVRRRDPLMAFLTALNSSVFWFHPLARWMESKLRLLCEEAADDACLEQLEDRERYVAILLEMAAAARGRGATLPWPAIAMARSSQVKRRIDRMLADGHRASRGLTRAGWLLAIAAAAPLLYSAAAVRLEQVQRLEMAGPPAVAAPAVQAAARPSAGQRPAKMLSTPYQKWVDEDAVYIIRPEERATYLALTSDAEREHFIEQFWLRRDPTPGTPENEFKEEHYRRIAYSNQRFVSGRPGWRTDRGRTYILYGPPDEIESHPAGSTENPTPWEQWRYRWIEGVGANPDFVFTDPGSKGEYRLASDTMQTPGPRWTSEFEVAMEKDQLQSEPAPTGRRIRLNVYVRVLDARRRMVSASEYIHNVAVDPNAPPHSIIWIRKTLLPLPAGTYSVHVVIKDVIGNRTFARDLTHTVTAPK